MVKRALNEAEEEGEYLDCVILKAQILFLMGREDDGRKAVEAIPPVEELDVDPDQRLEIGELFLEAGKPDAAKRQFEKLVNDHDETAEAQYCLGLACFALGDAQGGAKAWVRTHELDAQEDLAGPDGEFAVQVDRLLRTLLGGLPKELKGLIPADVEIRMADRPALADVAEMGMDPRQLGRFVPTETNDMGSEGGTVSAIEVFGVNLARACDLEEDMRVDIEALQIVLEELLGEALSSLDVSEDVLEKAGIN